MAAVRTDLPVG